MRVAVEKVPGVSKAVVSLNEGEVVITLEKVNDVTLDHLRSVIRRRGFTPRDADVRVRGRPELRGEAWYLDVAGSDASYQLVGGAGIIEGLAGRAGENVVLRGRVEEKGRGRLAVASVEPPPGDG